MILIAGAGLAGLSASYHLGHKRCLLLERNLTAFGHIRSENRDGFVWDQGPHVSFTKHEYVRKLFEESVDSQLEEIEVQVGNYFQGNWITHPAQTSLYQVPEPMRSACIESFLTSRGQPIKEINIQNYQQWLENAFGSVFANTFPGEYTKKYWTRSPTDLTIHWIGNRIHFPSIDEVKRGSNGPLDRSMHYISKVRYPRQEGYQSFAKKMKKGASIHYGSEIVSIDLNRKIVYLSSGQHYSYEQLVNTLPLPIFINACQNVPMPVIEASRQLSCSQLLLVNIAVPHEAQRPEHWIYVYDPDKLSTRISFTEKLGFNNAPAGWTGIQVEVYFSRHRPLVSTPEVIAEQVEKELIQMGLIVPSRFKSGLVSHRHYSYSPWANVIFDHGTVPALDTIWSWLATQGLKREEADTHPLTDWGAVATTPSEEECLHMAGRFGQWKYFWSDDCVMRGHQLGIQLKNKKL